MICEDCWWFSDERTRVCCLEKGEHSMKRVEEDLPYCPDHRKRIVYNPDDKGGQDGNK